MRVEPIAGGDADLLPYQVDSQYRLGDRMFDLEPGVHLEKVEILAGDDELDRARVPVADRPGRPDRGFGHRLPPRLRQPRRRSLLDQLLVAALDRALPLAQRQRGAVGVGQDLHLDVARLLQVALEVDRVVAEGGQGRAPAGFERRRQVLLLLNDPHPDAAAARGRLEQDRVAETRGRGLRRRLVLQAGRARHDRHPCRLHAPAGLDLVAHGPHARSARPDEDQARRLAGLGEAGVLGQEAVPRVDRVRSRAPGHVDQLIDVQVCLARRTAAQLLALLREVDVGRAAIRLGEDRHRGDPHLTAGPHHPQRDLAPVGDQDLGHRATDDLFGHPAPPHDPQLHCRSAHAASRKSTDPASGVC